MNYERWEWKTVRLHPPKFHACDADGAMLEYHAADECPDCDKCKDCEEVYATHEREKSARSQRVWENIQLAHCTIVGAIDDWQRSGFEVFSISTGNGYSMMVNGEVYIPGAVIIFRRKFGP